MRFRYERIDSWSKLAWVAVYTSKGTELVVFHGPNVETHPSWCGEIAWSGEFAAGAINDASIVAGTGVCLTEDGPLLISSADMLSRLHIVEFDDRIVASNSLPALMSVTGCQLDPNFDYRVALETVMDGVDGYQRELPMVNGNVRVLYLSNMLLTPEGIHEIPKPDDSPDFDDFETYRDYLVHHATRIGENARTSLRRSSVTPMATVSRGYDSVAAAVLARRAGAQNAVTIATGRRTVAQLINVSDSGDEVAKCLGLECRTYARHQETFEHELELWAGTGNLNDLNLTIFHYPEPVCLLFTGFMGDIVWGKETQPGPLLARKDMSGACFSECRLKLGVINCSPTFWGWQKEHQILALSHDPRNKPWSIDQEYDRPIPRRLAEEAGVQRNSFGRHKRHSSFARKYCYPKTPELRKDFADFLRAHQQKPMVPMTDTLALGLRAFDYVVLTRLPSILRFSTQNWISPPDPNWFFLWSNERLLKTYQQALADADAAPGSTAAPACEL